MRALASALAAGRIGKLRHIIASDKGYYGGYGLMNIGTHLVNNLLELCGRCRAVSAVALTAGRPISPQDVVPAPSGMGFIAGWARTAAAEPLSHPCVLHWRSSGHDNCAAGRRQKFNGSAVRGQARASPRP